MNIHLPDPVRELAILFKMLPGVGPKTALRFVYALLKESPQKTEQLARAMLSLHQRLKICSSCGGFTLQDPCLICRDSNRDASLLCVVAESRDIATIELTGEFQGHYFVLGGLLSPLDGITPDLLRVDSLIERASGQPEIKEIILALNPDLKGESTILYLTKQLMPLGKILTTLARGLPLGADLEYADEVTLADALKGRRALI
ncbi:recombination protein RecR [Candidatus Uhrbacteria bacterium]|nr:recombination protein RecR [Candidatus Uhrbacteria bacterium]